MVLFFEESQEDTRLRGGLSSGERAQAKIVTVLLEEWDALDGKQQRAIVDVLEKSTQASEDAEGFVERLRQRAKK